MASQPTGLYAASTPPDRNCGPGERAVRIMACWLPVKRPWLNAIEPKWLPGKKAIVAPDRKLTAGEVRERVCGHFGCEQLAPLKQKKQD